MATPLIIGTEIKLNDIPKSARNEANAAGYQLISLPIVHPRYRTFTSIESNFSAFTRSDAYLGTCAWKYNVIGSIDEDIDPDCGSNLQQKNNEDFFMQLYNYGMHLSLLAILIPLDRRIRPNLARILSDMMADEKIACPQAWMKVPLKDPRSASNEYRSYIKEESDPWEWWARFKLMCNSDARVNVALELTPDLPSNEVLSRWFGEPIKLVIIPVSIFLTNKKGYPVLSKAHQDFIRRCAYFGLPILLTGKHGLNPNYNLYIKHIYSQVENFENILPDMKGFCDHLQTPLEPLMDNLQSNTYEIFEKDPIKYRQYQKAIAEALLDRVPEEEAENAQVIMVVGAGRGPLVDSALAAGALVKRKIRCYAIEKNPYALITLLEYKKTKWDNKVEVVGCDMRVWNAPEKCDILVSELLGSFGDNELSPECLDGAQKFLKPDGISIPCEYTSYICPLQSSKLYNQARQMYVEKPSFVKLETPYVVYQVNIFKIAPPQPVFKFVHPNSVTDNRRYKKLTFDVNQNSVLYGFSGYFDTVLYKDIKLSILPDQESGKFSWFPIYFPIREPVYLRKGDKLDFHMWRLMSKTSVWYEWSISNPVFIPVHNQNGRSSKIGLL